MYLKIHISNFFKRLSSIWGWVFLMSIFNWKLIILTASRVIYSGLVFARLIFVKLKIWCKNVFQQVGFIQEIENFRRNLIPLQNLKDAFDTQMKS